MKGKINGLGDNVIENYDERDLEEERSYLREKKNRRHEPLGFMEEGIFSKF